MSALARARGAPDPRQVIEELVYERVRLDADLLALGDLERDLAVSFRRVLRELDDEPAVELGRLLDVAVERAFLRVAAELVEEEEPMQPDLMGCPRCEVLGLLP